MLMFVDGAVNCGQTWHRSFGNSLQESKSNNWL